jgi:NADPH:quinone reductase-like Zn-dependent oxidoreductase
MAGFPKPKKIKILGCDIAGRVEAAGNKVKRLKAGDEVFGDISGCRFGGFAEYVCASEDALTLKPAGMTFDEAAAIPQAGILALQGLRHKGHIQPGQKVLINGAGGGAGTFAIQIAKSYGTHVTSVDSTVKLEKMRSLGAEHVIDYTKEDFTKNGEHYDLILDLMGYHPFFDYKHSLSPGGKFVMVGGSSALFFKTLFLGALIPMTGSKKMGILMHKQNKDIDYMIELFEAGKVTPVIDRRFPLREVPEAMRYFGSGKHVGKVVISMEEKS